jgi:hypothetical protein
VRRVIVQDYTRREAHGGGRQRAPRRYSHPQDDGGQWTPRYYYVKAPQEARWWRESAGASREVGKKIRQLKDDWQVQKRRHRKYAAWPQWSSGAGAGGQELPAYDKEKCPYCYLGHRQGSCGAAGQSCYSCHGIGHFARTCRTEGAEDSTGTQQGGRRATYSSDSDHLDSSDDQEYLEGPNSEQSDDSTRDTQEESNQPEQDNQRLEGEWDRLSRALATLDGYQGTEPGPEEDKSGGTSEKQEEVESSEEEEDDGIKALREGTEPAWPGSQQWLKQRRKKKPKKRKFM